MSSSIIALYKFSVKIPKPAITEFSLNINQSIYNIWSVPVDIKSEQTLLYRVNKYTRNSNADCLLDNNVKLIKNQSLITKVSKPKDS